MKAYCKSCEEVLQTHKKIYSLWNNSDNSEQILQMPFHIWNCICKANFKHLFIIFCLLFFLTYVLLCNLDFAKNICYFLKVKEKQKYVSEKKIQQPDKKFIPLLSFRYVLEFGRINHIVVGQNALLVIYST